MDMGHTLKEECVQEEWGNGRKPKNYMWLICSLYRSEYNDLKLAEATLERGLRNSEEAW
jgi:hypothetical protein